MRWKSNFADPLIQKSSARGRARAYACAHPHPNKNCFFSLKFKFSREKEILAKKNISFFGKLISIIFLIILIFLTRGIIKKERKKYFFFVSLKKFYFLDQWNQQTTMSSFGLWQSLMPSYFYDEKWTKIFLTWSEKIKSRYSEWENRLGSKTIKTFSSARGRARAHACGDSHPQKTFFR